MDKAAPVATYGLARGSGVSLNVKSAGAAEGFGGGAPPPWFLMILKTPRLPPQRDEATQRCLADCGVIACSWFLSHFCAVISEVACLRQVGEGPPPNGWFRVAPKAMKIPCGLAV